MGRGVQCLACLLSLCVLAFFFLLSIFFCSSFKPHPLPWLFPALAPTTTYAIFTSRTTPLQVWRTTLSDELPPRVTVQLPKGPCAAGYKYREVCTSHERCEELWLDTLCIRLFFLPLTTLRYIQRGTCLFFLFLPLFLFSSLSLSLLFPILSISPLSSCPWSPSPSGFQRPPPGPQGRVSSAQGGAAGGAAPAGQTPTATPTQAKASHANRHRPHIFGVREPPGLSSCVCSVCSCLWPCLSWCRGPGPWKPQAKSPGKRFRQVYQREKSPGRQLQALAGSPKTPPTPPKHPPKHTTFRALPGRFQVPSGHSPPRSQCPHLLEAVGPHHPPPPCTLGCPPPPSRSLPPSLILFHRQAPVQTLPFFLFNSLHSLSTTHTLPPSVELVTRYPILATSPRILVHSLHTLHPSRAVSPNVFAARCTLPVAATRTLDSRLLTTRPLQAYTARAHPPACQSMKRLALAAVHQ